MEGQPRKSPKDVMRAASGESLDSEAIETDTEHTQLSAYRLHARSLAGAHHAAHDEVAFLNPKRFRVVISIAILLNTVQLGLCVKDDTLAVACVVSETVFTVIFGMEMTLKLIAQGLSYFKYSWNIMDFTLLWLSVTDLVTLYISDVHCTVCDEMTLLRLLKLLRTLRVFRILRAKQELAILVEGLFASLKAMVWVAVLLCVLVYAGGIFCAEAFSESLAGLNLEVDYFGTLIDSMMTLFSISVLDIWDDVVRPLVKVQPVAIIFFIGYIFVSSFGILNLLIGIITESAHKATSDFKLQQTLQCRQELMRQISDDAQELFVEDRLLSAMDMENADPRFLRKMLNEIELPPGFTVADLHLMCSPNPKISKADFIDAMRRFVFCSDFERDCLFQHSMNDLRRRFTSVEDDLRRIRKSLSTGRNRQGSGHNAWVSESNVSTQEGANSPRETSVNLHADGVAQNHEDKTKVDDVIHTLPKDTTVASVPDTGEQVTPRRSFLLAKEGAISFTSSFEEQSLRDSLSSLEHYMKTEISKIQQYMKLDLLLDLRTLLEDGNLREKGRSIENQINSEIWKMKESLQQDLSSELQHEQRNSPTDLGTHGQGTRSNTLAKTSSGIQPVAPRNTASPSSSVVGSYSGRAALETARGEPSRPLHENRRVDAKHPGSLIAALRMEPSSGAETDRVASPKVHKAPDAYEWAV